MLQKKVDIANKEEWDYWVSQVPHAIMHTWSYCHAISHSSKDKLFLYVYQNETFLVVCPFAERVFEGEKDLYTPYGIAGPTGNYSDPSFYVHWKEFMRSERYVCAYVGLNPLFEKSIATPEGKIKSKQEVFIVDLKKPKDDLYAALSNNMKRSLKAFAKQDLQLIHDKEILRSLFIKSYRLFMENKQAASVYFFSNYTLESLMDTEGVEMIGLIDGDNHSISIFGYTAFSADFLFNVTSQDAKLNSVPIMWSAIEKYHGMKVPYFNLGGGVQPNDSLAEFKRKFGAERYPLNYFAQVFDMEMYKHLCVMTNTDLGNDQFFPAYRSKNKKSTI